MKKSVANGLFSPVDLLVAGALLTRLPLPHAPDNAFEYQARASWSYPVIGAGLGLLGAALWWLCGLIGLPVMVQAGVTLAGMMLMTGALHEDGLADTADGLWGGHDPARRLEIMKDSAIGSYGVLALIMVTGLRWAALVAAGPWALIASATASRAMMPALMHTLPFARQTGLANSVGRPPMSSAVTALLFALVVAVLCTGIVKAALMACVTLVVAALVGAVAKRKIGGVTGDICGATQVLCETAILIALMS